MELKTDKLKHIKKGALVYIDNKFYVRLGTGYYLENVLGIHRGLPHDEIILFSLDDLDYICVDMYEEVDYCYANELMKPKGKEIGYYDFYPEGVW